MTNPSFKNSYSKTIFAWHFYGTSAYTIPTIIIKCLYFKSSNILDGLVISFIDNEKKMLSELK